MLEQRVTAESPKGPDCQSTKMNWLIYIFANFSSESLAATRKSGLTLQTRNCHLDASDISPLLTWHFSCDYVPLTPQWDPQIGHRTLLEFEEIKVLTVNESSSYTENGLCTIATHNYVILVLHPDLESTSLHRQKSRLWRVRKTLAAASLGSENGPRPAGSGARVSRSLLDSMKSVAWNGVKSFCNLLPTPFRGCDTTGVKPQWITLPSCALISPSIKQILTFLYYALWDMGMQSGT